MRMNKKLKNVLAFGVAMSCVLANVAPVIAEEDTYSLEASSSEADEDIKETDELVDEEDIDKEDIDEEDMDEEDIDEEDMDEEDVEVEEEGEPSAASLDGEVFVNFYDQNGKLVKENVKLTILHNAEGQDYIDYSAVLEENGWELPEGTSAATQLIWDTDTQSIYVKVPEQTPDHTFDGDVFVNFYDQNGELVKENVKLTILHNAAGQDYIDYSAVLEENGWELPEGTSAATQLIWDTDTQSVYVRVPEQSKPVKVVFRDAPYWVTGEAGVITSREIDENYGSFPAPVLEDKEGQTFLGWTTEYGDAGSLYAGEFEYKAMLAAGLFGANDEAVTFYPVYKEADAEEKSIKVVFLSGKPGVDENVETLGYSPVYAYAGGAEIQAPDVLGENQYWAMVTNDAEFAGPYTYEGMLEAGAFVEGADETASFYVATKPEEVKTIKVVFRDAPYWMTGDDGVITSREIDENYGSFPAPVLEDKEGQTFLGWTTEYGDAGSLYAGEFEYKAMLAAGLFGANDEAVTFYPVYETETPDPEPTVTPDPEPTETPDPVDPEPTETPDPVDPEPTETPDPVDPEPTETPDPVDPEPTEDPEPTVSPVPGNGSEITPSPVVKTDTATAKTTGDQTATTSKAVQTGDNTQIMLYVFVAFSALVSVAGVVFFKKRRKMN